MQAPALLQVSEVSKAFAAPVLKSIDLIIAAGEVVALTGENGAGKSTLSKIIAGVSAADSGNMLLNGQAYSPSTRAQAEQLGVRMVLQELGLIGTLTVAENLELGALPSRQGFIKRDELDRRARAYLDRVGLTDVHPSQPVSELGIGQQQLVEIARGLKSAAKVLILDEPTAMLTTNEVARLFAQIAQLKAQGVAVIYISHRLDELSRIADRIVVLRDGSLVADRPSAKFRHDDIVRAMVGDIAMADANRPRRATGAEVLRLQSIGGGRVRDVSLSLHAGEILGVAGLVGSGRTELLRLIFSTDRKTSGEMYLDDRLTSITSPTQAVEHGIGWLTEDRKSEGLFLSQSIDINLTVADLAPISSHGWISHALERSAVTRWLQRLRIRARDNKQSVSELSGGNQQKVLLARWLHRDCRILLLDEPTRGVDIGTRADIYAELDALAAAGKALLVVSSDLRELMDICDRIAVMSNGALVQIFTRGEWSEQMLLAAAFSGHSAKQAVASLQ